MASKGKFKLGDWVTHTNRKKIYTGQVLEILRMWNGELVYYVGRSIEPDDDNWMIVTEDELKLINQK